MVFAKIVARYPDIENPKHRMALFKTAFRNHIHDLSKKKSALALVTESDLAVPINQLRDGEDPEQDPDLVFVIKQLPPAIARVIRRLYAEDRGHPFRRYLDHTRETTNERACRLAGLDPAKRNVKSALQSYFSGDRIHPQYEV